MLDRIRNLDGRLASCLLCLVGAPDRPSNGEAGGNIDQAGLQLELAYTGEVWRNANGGLRTGTRYLDNVDVIGSWIPDADVGFLSDSEFRLHVLGNNSQRLTQELVGDLQSVSNIDAPRTLRLYEAWFETEFGSRDGQSWRIGIYDLNSEFDVIESAAAFLNGSHGIGADFGQSGSNGPSIFPITGLALRVEVPLSEEITARWAVLDAVPGDPRDPRSHSFDIDEGALLVAELDAALTGGTRATMGTWMYTHDAKTLLPADTQSAPERAKATGAYLGLDAPLDDDERLNAFLRLGIASEDVHEISRYAGLGIGWQPPGSIASMIGIAIAHARTSDIYRSLLLDSGHAASHAETSIELTAQFRLAANLMLQPDVQYVVDPGANKTIDDALVVGLRVQWSRTWPN